MSPKALALLISGAVVALDRGTKAWIEASISLHDTRVVIPGFFNIIHTQNTGMAFGLLADAPGAWRTILLIGVALAVLAAVSLSLWNLPAKAGAGQKYTRLGLALILGGAVGNLYDRIARGSVTDFLEFYAGAYSWPAFNIADSAITIGAALLVIDLLRSRRPASET